tara:strand:- start:1880 stop:2032 length:153 start_codon:yes stop_codon:yes gene_type:complete
MNEKEALDYAMQVLEEQDVHCNTDEERAELAEAIAILDVIKYDYYEDDEL